MDYFARMLVEPVSVFLLGIIPGGKLGVSLFVFGVSLLVLGVVFIYFNGKPRWPWSAQEAAGVVLVLMVAVVVAGSVYFVLVEREKRLVEDKVKTAVALAEKMAEIPEGTFRMGDLSKVKNAISLPVHKVKVPSFRMGKYEVTFSQWDACVADGGCNGYRPDDRGWGRGNRPVISVSWDDAQAFIVWLNEKTSGGYRLPTESEWEYAVRAKKKNKYSWGDKIEVNRANCEGCKSEWDGKGTAPVGSFRPYAWGLRDMHGNVWEWVEDCWNDDYEGAPDDGSAWVDEGCSRRVIRGGSWSNNPRHLRSSYRGRDFRSARYIDRGFRLARDR